MRVITNQDIIENRSTWARRVSPLAMVVLLGGFIINLYSFNRPELSSYTFILLMVGLFLAIFSSNLVNRWVREPRADQVLATTLKKFSNDHILFNYTTSPPHILLTPTRLYAVTVKRQTGQITANGNRFSRKFSLSRIMRFFAEEGLGVPFAEAQNNVNKLEKRLKKNMTTEEIPEIKPLIFFVNKEVELTVNDPVLPVLRSNELKGYLREHDKQKTVSAAQRDTLIEIIGGKYRDSEA